MVSKPRDLVITLLRPEGTGHKMRRDEPVAIGNASIAGLIIYTIAQSEKATSAAADDHVSGCTKNSVDGVLHRGARVIFSLSRFVGTCVVWTRSKVPRMLTCNFRALP